MSNEEAIEVLKVAKGYIKYGGIAEAVDVAISAVEKQIPKKVKRDKSSFGLDYCPTCGIISPQKVSKYCDCGQLLDWSDSE